MQTPVVKAKVPIIIAMKAVKSNVSSGAGFFILSFLTASGIRGSLELKLLFTGPAIVEVHKNLQGKVLMTICCLRPFETLSSFP